MPFKDIIGHDQTLLSIRTALFGGRPGHAFLFAGPDGVGKYLAAVEVARLLLCEKPAEGGRDSCGACRACRQAGHDNHPDLHLVEAEEGKRFIALKQTQELCKQYALRPHGSRRIAVMRDADRMTDEAANSLLKTLEEPPAWGMLVLTASRPSSLPETILSRCQTLRFAPLARKDAARVLHERLGWDAADADFAAAFSDGALGLAVQMREIGGTELRDFLADRLGRLTRQDNFAMAAEALARTADLGRTLEAQRQGLRLVFRMIARHFRDVLAVQIGIPEERLFNASRIADLREHAGRMPQPLVEAAVEATLSAWAKLNRNANLQLLLENYFFELGGLTEGSAG